MCSQKSRQRKVVRSMQVSKSHDLVTLTANNYYQENDKMFRMADMRMAGPGGQESVRVLGCSENMTGQARNLVIRVVQEHLSLEATHPSAGGTPWS